MDVRNIVDAMSATPETKAKLKNSPISGEASQMFYQSMQAERKSPSAYKDQNNDLEQVSKTIDESMEFATQLMLISAKNMGFPDEDGGSNKSTEMMDMAKGISEMMVAKANVSAQIEQLKANKNPAIDLMTLKDKLVEYKDDTKTFYGKPIIYNYNVSYSNQSTSSVVTNKFTITDENGRTVRDITQKGKSGKSSLEWDGKDNSGNEVLPGKKYTLSIKSEGVQNINGVQTSFPVVSGATLSGIVDSVKVEKGSAVGVVIDGILVERDQIMDVRDVIEHNDVALTPDLIGQQVELDLSKGRAKDGKMDVYFYNHVENSGKLRIEISDGNKHLMSYVPPQENAIGIGASRVTIPVELENGEYNVKVSVQDVTDLQNIVNVDLKDKRNVVIGSIVPKSGIFLSTSEEAYSASNIGAIIGNYELLAENNNNSSDEYSEIVN